MKSVIQTSICVFIASSFVDADERKWDQEKAMATVKKVEAIEKLRPLPYEKIPWMTDMAKVEQLSKQQQKPIFVYWYVDKGGPEASPC